MRISLLTLLLVWVCGSVYAADTFVKFTPDPTYFPLISKSIPVGLVIDENEDAGIKMAAERLQNDLLLVSGNKPMLSNQSTDKCVIIGSFGSATIQQLIKAGKIAKSELDGKREKFIILTVKNPTQAISEALVIAGSDKRGTIYGIYELSKQIGVSPWYWWMDVPVVKQDEVHILPGTYTDGEPKVEYRGIFLNDEAPCLSGWSREKFGGFNCKFYANVFELLLRLKGNFLWPAMWGNAFYHDDPENGVLADKMGIVMSTSHHEPMGMAQKDWSIRRNGDWDYSTNGAVLRDFWTQGIERSKDWEKVITIGMRGDGDEPMSEESNIALLEKIVNDQRAIIKKVTGKAASKTPQVWALYKEVQDYYDRGMRVPDDVTLLLCDDNWGNVRKLPKWDAKPRKGGYGMYYHFDYVGAPRNSKWINISPIPRIWEQMNLTYQYGVRKLWIVNVGDLKPMEYPITFFLDMAWNPERFNETNLTQHAVAFCSTVFGAENAEEAARILRTYAKYNRRITPELLNSNTYSFNYNEWERVVNDYNLLAVDAYSLRTKLPQQMLDAYDQLINHPVQACTNLYNMYYAHAKNRELAKKNDTQANYWADRVEAYYKRDAELSHFYNKVMADGKWNHMMDQVHIGYTSWNNPDNQVIPKVVRVEAQDKQYSFEERDGYVSIEAEHYTRCHNGEGVAWSVIPELGKTLSGVTTLPVTVSPEGMALEYDMELKTKGEVKVIVRFSPTLNFNDSGLRYAIGFDSDNEQIININGHYKGELGEWQANHVIDSSTIHVIKEAGKHTLRIRPLDAGLVFQKIQIDLGGLKTSYLGAPETLK